MKLETSVEKVRLKKGVLIYLEVREWEFQKVEDGMILLTHP
jgi:hypothetical protein